MYYRCHLLEIQVLYINIIIYCALDLSGISYQNLVMDIAYQDRIYRIYVQKFIDLIKDPPTSTRLPIIYDYS